MIIDLNLKGKTVVILGAGKQAERRIKPLLQERCAKIIVISLSTSSDQILQWSESDLITLVTGNPISDLSFIGKYKPDLLIAATDDPTANASAVNAAQSCNILAYRSDSHEQSDYAHPATIQFDDKITVAIFTGGQSPVVSKYIRQRAEAALSDIITPHILAHLSIQDMVRRAAKSKIAAQEKRKQILETIMSDNLIDQLIRDGKIQDAKERAMSILGDKQ